MWKKLVPSENDRMSYYHINHKLLQLFFKIQRPANLSVFKAGKKSLSALLLCPCICLLMIVCVLGTGLSIAGEAKNNKKFVAPALPQILFFYTDQCRYCNKMINEVLNDKNIREKIKGGVRLTSIDVDVNTDLSDLYNINAYPTTWLLTHDGKRLMKIPGFIPKDIFEEIVVYMSTKQYQTTDLRTYLKKKGKM